MIRPATPTDLELLERLERASFPDPWTRASLQTALTDAGYLVLLWDELGFVLGWNTGDEAEIARLGVVEAARGQGIGAALVERALSEFKARDVTTVFLEVREENHIARRLYGRLGFAEIARRAGYYSDGMDAVVMRRSLAP